MEWQSALFKASKGETKLIPVRISNFIMPDVLKQSVYIDYYSVGIEAAITQVVNIIQGNSSFTPSHEGFSNLTWRIVETFPDGFEFHISASHLMEPNPQFIMMLKNVENEIDIKLNGGDVMMKGFYEKPFSGFDANGITIAPMGGAITPDRPMTVRLIHKSGGKIKMVGLVHGFSEPRHVVPKK